MKTLQMHSEGNLPGLPVLSSHPKISTNPPLETRLVSPRRHQLSPTTAHGAEPTQYNRHQQPRLHGQVRNHLPSLCLEKSKNGSLLRHLVGHLVLSKSIPGKRVVVAVEIAQSVRQMFWKCLITRHGVNRLGGVSPKKGVVSVRWDLFMTAENMYGVCQSRRSKWLGTASAKGRARVGWFRVVHDTKPVA